MTIDQFLDKIADKRTMPMAELEAFEAEIGERLPGEYREFLIACNGGLVEGRLIFDDLSAVHAVLGIREDFPLLKYWRMLRGRVPAELLVVIDDSFSNFVCIGLRSVYRGRIYFWNVKKEPFSGEWDGRLETAEHITLLANSFTEFVGLLELSPYGPI